MRRIGRAHARAVAESVGKVARSIRIVGPLEGKDLSDHLAAGHGVEELVQVDLNKAGRKPENRDTKARDRPEICISGRQLEAVAADFEIVAAKTGMLAGADIIHAIVRGLDRGPIERLVGTHVHLELFVKVDPTWLTSRKRIESLGYH